MVGRTVLVIMAVMVGSVASQEHDDALSRLEALLEADDACADGECKPEFLQLKATETVESKEGKLALGAACSYDSQCGSGRVCQSNCKGCDPSGGPYGASCVDEDDSYSLR